MTADRLRDLHALSQRDPDVKAVVNMVCAHHDTNIIDLAETHPEVFDELYDQCMEMISDLGEYGQLGGNR